MSARERALSVSSSQNGRQLLFSVNSGNLELDYPIGSASDNLLTPDFRLLLPGPGKIHVAMRVSANGDTCVESLPTNSSALVVAEAMGDESYQVKQDEAVLFKGGHIQGATRTHQSCGCPAPAAGAGRAHCASCGSSSETAAPDQRSRIGRCDGRIRARDAASPPLDGGSLCV